MRKISYSLNLGVISLKSSEKRSGSQLIVDFLKNKAIEDNLPNVEGIAEDHLEFFIVFKQIPIKVRAYLVDNFNQLVLNYKKIQKIDVLIFAVNLYDLDAIDLLEKEEFDEFRKTFSFWGTSILVGIDVNRIFRIPPSPKGFRLSKERLIKKAKELNVLYCFEIKYKYKDLKEFSEKILNDYIIKIEHRSPEFFNEAKAYGDELVSKYKFLEDK